MQRCIRNLTIASSYAMSRGSGLVVALCCSAFHFRLALRLWSESQRRRTTLEKVATIRCFGVLNWHSSFPVSVFTLAGLAPFAARAVFHFPIPCERTSTSPLRASGARPGWFIRSLPTCHFRDDCWGRRLLCVADQKWPSKADDFEGRPHL